MDLFDEENVTSEEIKCENCTNCTQGKPCISCISKTDENEYYKLMSQFQEMNINVLTDNNILELLKQIKDSSLRDKIIDELGDSSSNEKNSNLSKKIINNNYYNMGEVEKLLRLKNTRQNLITSYGNG